MRPVGIPYPEWMRLNIVDSTQSHADTAKVLNVSVSTVKRVRYRWRDFGDCQVGRQNVPAALRKCTLSPTDCEILSQFVGMYPQATLMQLQNFLFIGLHIAVSTATVSRELRRLGFSRKKINRYSIYRRESDRVNWWLKPPASNGCLGVLVDDLVDIDESKFTWESAERKFGYSLMGYRAKAPGIVSIRFIFTQSLFLIYALAP